MVEARPPGITALSFFFLFGTVVSFVCAVSLAFPGSFLEPMWRLNPRAREAFGPMGAWAVALLAVVCIACALSAIGLWRGRRWGHRLAAGVLAVNLAGDAANAILGIERRAIFGIPVAISLLAFLGSRRVRSFFDRPAAAPEPRPAIGGMSSR